MFISFNYLVFIIILSTCIYTSFTLSNRYNKNFSGYQQWYQNQPTFHTKVKFEVPFYHLHNAIRRLEM